MARANRTGSVGVGSSKPPRGHRRKRRGKRRSGWFSTLLLELGSLALLLAIVQPTLWETWLIGTVAERVSDPAANSPTAEPEPGSVKSPVDSVKSAVDVARQQVESVDPVRNELPVVRRPLAQSIARPAAVPVSRPQGYGASWSSDSAASGNTLPFGSAVQGRLRIPALPASIGGLSGY